MNELGLRGIPERIVRFGGFELTERVEVFALVLRVIRERFQGPRGKGFELIEVGAVRTEVVAEFAPGDEFIKKAFGGGAHVPPAFAAALGSDCKFRGIPVFPEG